jgi:hypothetical protein
VPVITADGNKNVTSDAGKCGATVVLLASATDNCTVGTPTGTRSDNQLLTAAYPVGTTTITWNVADASGNAAVAVTQTVTVTDNPETHHYGPDGPVGERGRGAMHGQQGRAGHAGYGR